MLRLFRSRLSTPHLGLLAAKFGAGLPSFVRSRHRRIFAGEGLMVFCFFSVQRGEVNRFIARYRFRCLGSSAPAPTTKEQHQRPEHLPRHGLERLKQHHAPAGNRAGGVGLSGIDFTCCVSEFWNS
jgi:hypothetical protein